MYFSGQNLLIRLEDLIAEHLDHLHYLNDILRLNIDDLNSLLSDNLLHRLIIPLYLHSFLSVLYRNLSPVKSNQKTSEFDARALVPNASLSPSVALFLLTQAYIIFSYGPLLNSLVNFMLKSSKTDIELNAKRCEFTPPNKSLEAAIELAISTSTNIPSSNVNTDSDSSSTKEETIQLKSNHTQNQSDHKIPNLQTSLSEEPRANNPNESSSSSNHDSNYSNNNYLPDTNSSNHRENVVPMETDSSVPVMTIKNWPEFPFLIGMLSALNTNIASNSLSVESELSSGRTSRNRSASDSVGDANCNGDPLSKSCHSPIVTRSIVELSDSNADDRVILFTLSLISSILSNKCKLIVC